MSPRESISSVRIVLIILAVLIPDVLFRASAIAFLMGTAVQGLIESAIRDKEAA